MRRCLRFHRGMEAKGRNTSLTLSLVVATKLEMSCHGPHASLLHVFYWKRSVPIWAGPSTWPLALFSPSSQQPGLIYVPSPPLQSPRVPFRFAVFLSALAHVQVSYPN